MGKADGEGEGKADRRELKAQRRSAARIESQLTRIEKAILVQSERTQELLAKVDALAADRDAGGEG
jgi:hypothetical protein